MTHLTVDSVTARAVSVPLNRPVIAAIGRFDMWPIVLVDIRFAEGVVGKSYISPYRAAAMPAIVKEILDLGRVIAGSTSGPIDMFDRARAALNTVGDTGISTIARSAIDMALWDGLAKAAGLPLVELLGGSVGPIRTYNSNGLWRHDPNTLAEEAAELLQQGGFSAVKLRLGYEKLSDDLKALRAVKAAIGDDVELMVDFNQALGLGDALRRLHALDDEGIYWFEEPIAYTDIHGYAALAAVVRTPLQQGENFYGPRDLFDMIQAGGAHYAMADLERIGGVSGWLRTAGLAGAAGIQLSNHLYPEFSAHLLRTAESAHWCEWVDWAEPVLAEPLRPRDGFLTVPDKPGAGIDWDEDAVKAYLVFEGKDG